MMFKVTVQSEKYEKFVPIMEHAINDAYKKIIGASAIYGDKLIRYLIESEQLDLLMDAINGRLDEGNVLMDKETYELIYGDTDSTESAR